MIKKILALLFLPFIINAQTAFISGDQVVCDNSLAQSDVEVSFASGVPPYTFIYAIDGITESSITTNDNPYYIKPKQEGVYTLTYFSDANISGGINGSAIVTVLESPTAIFTTTSDTLSNLYPYVQLNDISLGNIVAWKWDFGDGSLINSTSKPDHTFPLYVFGCTNSAAFNYDPLANTDDGLCVSCTNSFGGYVPCYSASNIPLSNCFKEENSKLGKIGIYQLNLIITDDFGCSDTTFKQLWVADDYWIYIPNSFTPNNDMLNDKFCIKFNGIRQNTFLFKVYNVQGSLVYQSTSTDKLSCCDNQGWDGTYFRTQEKLSSGIYTYNLFFQETEGWKHNKYGTISLIR